MKRKTKIVLFSFLTINFILQIIYQFIIRMKIPYEWWDVYRNLHYPQKIVDHLADCFFIMNYIFAGYLIFEGKYYHDNMAEDKKTNKWRYCAQTCQIGGLVAYAILWLGLTDYPLFQPADIPHSFVFMLIREKMTDEQWDNWIGFDVGYTYCIYVVIILAPVFLFFILNLIHFLKVYLRRKKAGYPDKKWNRWNIIYITIFLILFFWTFESLRGFDLMSKIPGFSTFLRDYYLRKPFVVPPTWSD